VATSVNPRVPPKGQLTGRTNDPLRAGLPAWSTFAEESGEDVPDLRWPASIDTNDRIGKSGQVAALLRLLKLPINNYVLTINPGSMDPARVGQAAARMGMPVADAPDVETFDPKNGHATRSRLLRDTLRALTIGHSVLEIVGDEPQRGVWDLADLVYLSPRSLSRWQFVQGSTDVELIEQITGPKPLELYASRLAILRWGLDPDMPYGESMLRPLYSHWLSKDRLMRVDLIAAQRNGMGIPWTEAAAEASAGHSVDYERLVTGVAAGEDTGLNLPNGAQFHLQGVTGKTHDILASIKYHDEQMARTMGGEIMSLGTSATGSRALGDSFGELLWQSRDSIVEWVCESLTEQVLHRHAIWNGADPASDDLPRIEWARPQVAEPLTAQDWAALANAGLVDESPEARAEFARRYSLPVSDGNEDAAAGASGPGGSPAPVAASHTHDTERVAAAVARDTGIVPGVPQAARPLSDVEDTSRWPFARIQTAWAAARDTLLGIWRRVRTNMISASVAEIAAVEDLASAVDELHDLARAAAVGSVAPRLLDQAATVAAGLADTAAAHVVEAAAGQGVTVTPVDVDYDEQAAREARAVSKTLAFTVADQIARRADALAVPGANSSTVARLVEQDMATLTDALLEDVSGATATRAQNAGQSAQSAQAWGDGQVRSAYYSSLLDGRTCPNCLAADGREYTDMDDIRRDFPTSGYIECEGRERCRCTWVLVMADETPATVGL
jgi:hypothetical protein